MTGAVMGFSPFRHPPLLAYIIARAAATVAFQMMGVAVGWQIYDITHRALDLGLVGLVQFIPSLLLVFFVGHVADRYDRKRIVILAQSAEALSLLGLLALIFLHAVSRENMFIFLFFIGIARAFEFSTAQTIIPSLVTTEQLSRSIAAASSVRQAATIAGPVLGGALYLMSPFAVYGCSLTLFVLSATIISRITLVKGIARPTSTPGLQTVFAGISFIRNHPVILGAISLDLFAVLLGGATALLPIYARDILVTGPQGLGLLRAAPSVGALGASLWMARYPLKNRVGSSMFLAVVVFGVMTVIFAVSRSITLSCVALFVLGWADMISVVIRSSLVQLETPDEMRGRVSAVNAVFIGTSNELGEFESGVTAAWLGPVTAAVVGGVGTILVAFIWMRLFPQLLRRDRLHSHDLV